MSIMVSYALEWVKTRNEHGNRHFLCRNRDSERGFGAICTEGGVHVGVMVDALNSGTMRNRSIGKSGLRLLVEGIAGGMSESSSDLPKFADGQVVYRDGVRYSVEGCRRKEGADGYVYDLVEFMGDGFLVDVPEDELTPGTPEEGTILARYQRICSALEYAKVEAADYRAKMNKALGRVKALKREKEAFERGELQPELPLADRQV